MYARIEPPRPSACNWKPEAAYWLNRCSTAVFAPSLMVKSEPIGVSATRRGTARERLPAAVCRDSEPGPWRHR